jgi:predicted phage baseplate assembly protein
MMPLQTPNLDDRKFQDIVSEARSKIPQYCPKWTNYNLSDPGITLIELFAWMVDLLLYRVNKVPEKNYIKFMDLLGIRLQPPKSAQADVTFRLSGPQHHLIMIPRSTVVATVRTETQEAISFSTDEDLQIIIPDLAYALTTLDNASYTDVMASLSKRNKPVTVFKPVPEENNALYLGFRESLRAMTLILSIDSNIEGIGVDPLDPPLVWEYWDGSGEKWHPLKLEKDSTGGFNVPGNVIVYFPYTAATKDINGQSAFWIRCRATKPRTGQRPYVSSPRIQSIEADCIGGTVPARHCLRVPGELLGRSNGAPGQIFNLHNTPVLSRESGEFVEIETDKEGQYEAWQEVADFSQSGADDSHYTLDSVSGELQFGPLIRQPSGEERRYGKIPPSNRQIRYTSYRWGGGVIGNVGKETVTVLKSSIPYVASVTNFSAAVGGRDAETLEAAMMRAPRILRNQTRAVTAADFESLAIEATPKVARARCLAAGSQADSQVIPPGVVRVLLVPDVEDLEGPIPKDQLDLPGSLKSAVQAYLDERRLLAMRVEIAAPEYLQVAVEAAVRVKPGIDTEKTALEVKRRLYQFVSPVCGGPDGRGWPFGRSLYASDLLSLVQNTSGVEYIDEVKFFSVDWTSGQRQEINGKLKVPSNSLVCSAEHKVTARIIEED